MKPGPQRWATNATFSGGPDVGSPTKAELPAGYDDDGHYRNRAVAPDLWNMYRWRMSERAQNVAMMRLKNLQKKNTTNLAYAWANNSNPMIAGSGGEDNYVFVFAGDAGAAATASSRTFSETCGEYYNGLTPILAAGAAYYPFDAMVSGPGDAGAGGGFVAGYDSAAGVRPVLYWTAGTATLNNLVSSGALGDAVYCIATDGGPYNTAVSNWCFYNFNTPDIRRAANCGAAAASVYAAPAPIGGIVALRHTQHGAGALYPADPGNNCWICLVSGAAPSQHVCTDNGTTWAAVVPGGTMPVVASTRSLAYSMWGSRWGCISGITTATCTFGYSDDNGANWSAGADSFGMNAGPYAGNIIKASLACDGFGSWLAAFVVNQTLFFPSSTDYQYVCFGSVDNGETWEKIAIPDDQRAYPNGAAATHASIDVFWYDGAFWISTFGYNSVAAAAVNNIYSTLKSEP